MAKNSHKSILVVEDDSAIRELLETALVLEGYSVRTASHGQEAWTVLQDLHNVPHLLIVDLMMPVMDGTEFLKLKNNSADHKEIPTIVMSAAPEKRFPEETRYQSNVKKPIDLNIFLQKIETLLA